LSTVPRKSVLVTGAAGFIGGACVREFVRRGWRVTALVHRNLPSHLEELERAGSVSLVRASITDGEPLREALARFQEHQGAAFCAVVHCAGRATDIGRDSRFRSANFDGLKNVAAFLKGHPPGRLIHISTTDVYGLKDFRDADEDTPLCNNTGNPYPKYKILAEKWIRQNLPPERFVILRPAAVWGPGDTTILPRILQFLRSSPAIFHFGKWRGRNRWPLAYIRNVAAAAALACGREEALGCAFNVLDGERTSIEEFYRILLATFFPERADLRSVTLPFAAGWVLGCGSTSLSNILGRSHPLFDPSLYGLTSVSVDLDFSNRRLADLFSFAGETLVDRETAIGELRRWAQSSVK
jgi:2-alkyl-3-oxoalkanoate reductase